jgi:hypothetical protein
MLVTRVFNLKLEALLKDIKDGVLGNVIAKIWVIEFQKRGLPHAHILFILDEVSNCTPPRLRFDVIGRDFELDMSS